MTKEQMIAEIGEDAYYFIIDECSVSDLVKAELIDIDELGEYMWDQEWQN